VYYKRLGKTGLEVSKVSYRAWGISKNHRLGAEDDESLRALFRAIDLDLNFTDTALAYGEGQSERLVGRKREVYERVRAIVSERGVSEDEMAKVALCYVLSYSAALTGIPDMRSVCNVKGNMAVGDGKSLPEGQV
jgi:aryl-alcohol dehydrogenase-like predicted oxidoreductase